MSPEILKYYAEFGFQIDAKSFAAVNQRIQDLTDKLRNFSFSIKIDKISINKKDIRDSLTKAMEGTALPINNFKVNATQLRRQVQNAFDRGVNLTVNARGRTSGGTASTSGSSGNRRIGTAEAVLGRFGARAIGGYSAFLGLGGINQIGQDLQAGKMSLNTITKGRGSETYNWLKNMGNEVGVDYRASLPLFSNYMASSINKQGYDKSLDSFKSLSQYGMTHGATSVSMQRAMAAIGQMWSKGQIYAEELNQQLAEATGFGGSKELFAEAYQRIIGGKLSGQQSEAAMLIAAKEGKLKSRDILPIVTQLMQERAQGGISTYSNSAQAAQNRFRNAWSSGIEKFWESGFSDSIIKFFNTLTDGLNGSSKALEGLGKGFKAVTELFAGLFKYGKLFVDLLTDIHPSVEALTFILFPLFKILGKTAFIFTSVMLVMDDIIGYFQGKDSLTGRIADWFEKLTGFDFDLIAAGITVIGGAMLMAFSPITALAAGITALIAAYEYLKKLKESPLVTPTSKSYTVPSKDSVNDYTQRELENKYRLADGVWDTTKAGAGLAWSNSNRWLSRAVFGQEAIFLNDEQQARARSVLNSNGIQGAVSNNLLSKDMAVNLSRSVGAGMYNEADIPKILSNLSGIRSGYNSTGVLGAGKEPQHVYHIDQINVETNDPKAFEKKFMEQVGAALPAFSYGTKPANSLSVAP